MNLKIHDHFQSESCVDKKKIEVLKKNHEKLNLENAKLIHFIIVVNYLTTSYIG